MGTIANAKVTHYYNCYNGDFIGCLRIIMFLLKIGKDKMPKMVCVRESKITRPLHIPFLFLNISLYFIRF